MRPDDALGGAAAAGREAEIVWFHRAPETDTDALVGLLNRLRTEDDALGFVVTGHGPPLPEGLATCLQVTPGTSAEARAFLDSWRPAVLVWMRGRFVAPLLAEADQRGVVRILADAAGADLGPPRSGWLAARRNLMRGFRHALALDADAAYRLRRAGLAEEQVELSGPLEESAVALPGSERRRAGLAEALAGRPVWFVPGVQASEVEALIAAHQKATRRAHRLLMVMMPDRPAEAEWITDALRGSFKTSCRSEGDEPTEACQALMADEYDEAGVWYRLAPLTFMGGTLGTGSTRSPYEPAALGSAVLHGPHTGAWSPAFLRLAQAGAARGVQDTDDLGNVIETLLAPDQAARMAHAAWESISSGAPVTNRLLDLIRDALDEAGF
ncbi:Putative 3-deoxy-D-manno-octulosonic-acid transferase [Oceanicola granulosus HTCC2516]|uniref:3-deoxy-D-manno-octulosonic acid transferase n=1 Tax=Oceanicola granulosus (strain ATCC BAA-861 / DSM 15982 / KCTC 12143 / HTCC2516) TaxID=314256 RepID=Q2CCX4_OCEGH|nr:glycosyltransferase N-terminal domain-containing protein [Oceanicola granulosus]EAR50499.1 Putative 3-deoxy-D-manno-octulosonic-acid transferase [Oceanicola granulosus HTCC2516]